MLVLVNRDRVYNAARDAKRNVKPKNFSLGLDYPE